jgi:hypothetical protein
MQEVLKFRPKMRILLMIAGICLTSALANCSELQGAHPMPVTPFIAMAKASPCNDIRNRLFLIDQNVMFWDRAGKCPDNSYEFTLFGATPTTVLAVNQDSIAGPRTNYHDENYRPMFDTIMKNRDKADLGLGGKHQVQAIPF